MITLYHCMSARSFRPLWMLEELGLPYELVMLPQHLGLASRFTSAVKAYWERLQQRDAYIRALRSQEAAALAQGVSTVAAPDSIPDTIPATRRPDAIRR
jgi:hypothetical protein